MTRIFKVVDTDNDLSLMTVRVHGGGTCHLEIGEVSIFTMQSFFVAPESPVGAIAMVIASMDALAGFLYFRSRKPIAAG
ncbi:MAG: hypothetical protein MN733_39530 [Nitrososphaera sp.]|nr:hypothetical protein [Nitrososphaera sp.]